MRILMGLFLLLSVCSFSISAFAETKYAKKIGQHGGWAVYDYDMGEHTVCFASSRPSKISPQDAGRAPVRIYISTWPEVELGDPGHEREISIRVGLPVKSANVKIDGKPFTLFGDGLTAFVFEIDQEQKIVTEMKKGKTLAITAVLEDGSVSNDIYSLSGVSAAIKTLDRQCGAGRLRGKPGLDPKCIDASAEIAAADMVEAKKLMEKGPEYARANYSKKQLKQIGAYFALAEILKFRCSEHTPPPRLNPKR